MTIWDEQKRRAEGTFISDIGQTGFSGPGIAIVADLEI